MGARSSSRGRKSSGLASRSGRRPNRRRGVKPVLRRFRQRQPQAEARDFVVADADQGVRDDPMDPLELRYELGLDNAADLFSLTGGGSEVVLA